MSPLNIALLVIMAISAVLTVILILMIAASMYNATAGSGIWEKNLDRLTVLFAVIFGICICVMALTFPVGTIAGM